MFVNLNYVFALITFDNKMTIILLTDSMKIALKNLFSTSPIFQWLK